ncbi:MAG: hypothetical protein ACRBF0_09125 [Calditrichia bacterium]
MNQPFWEYSTCIRWGFFIDSAKANNRMDKALLLILVTALLNMLIDAISQVIRKRLRVSQEVKSI